ncbi:unnamed protein product [Tilletia controversa]|nr:unnamed protein product [Tilletia controversa]
MTMAEAFPLQAIRSTRSLYLSLGTTARPTHTTSQSSHQAPTKFLVRMTAACSSASGVNAFKKDHPELVSGNLTCATVNVPDYRTVREDCGQQRRQHWNRSLADCGKIIAILTSTVTSAWTITLPLPPHCGLITSK